MSKVTDLREMIDMAAKIQSTPYVLDTKKATELVEEMRKETQKEEERIASFTYRDLNYRFTL